jgi:hypothetical protein
MIAARQHKKEYATVGRTDGVNYREIAEIMTALGYDMNHSSARNHLIRIMEKFYVAYCEAQGFAIPDDVSDAVCRSPNFQEAVSQLIQQLEGQRRTLKPVRSVEPVRTVESNAVRRKVYPRGRGVCIRHRSQIFVPSSTTNAIAGSEVVLCPAGDETKVEVHVPGASAEEWIVRVG